MTAKKPRAKGGRPSLFSDALAAKICGRLALGESLRSICRDAKMPNASTVFDWLAKHEKFAEQYARAREAQADALADEITDIADDASNDWMERNQPDNPGWQFNGEAARRSQIRIDARKWVASKLKPKKYGDKLSAELSGKDGGPIETRNTHDLGASIAFALRKAAKS